MGEGTPFDRGAGTTALAFLATKRRYQTPGSRRRVRTA